MAQRLSGSLGQLPRGRNRAGAGGLIGTDAVAKAAPDGYTLLSRPQPGSIVTSPLVQRTPFDAERTPHRRHHRDRAARPAGAAELPAQNVAEFVALLRANPGRYTFSSSGTGSTSHVMAAWFHALAGVEVVHVLSLAARQPSPPSWVGM